ncbi:T9SS type A sorting domain-containing protein [Aequorivita antarctica]|uniref:T9SS type A sorting domain-containing protein n=1 Tax=Aequorivita antarctica TaxID=153266 RepID=UPI000DBBEF4C|nr:T9SS type A sorting domain-containing protein [Aequorivita antarctica]SRX72317.1 Beta-agarase A [Aequorivita antarctica]
MKALLYILLFNLSAISFAQDPQLFENTWYLYEVMSTDLGTFYDVSLINPPISPYLDISEDLTFNGEGACNTFSGTYELFPPNELGYMSFTATTNDCGIQQHNWFENEYFSFIAGGFWFSITQDNGGKVLSMSSPLMGYAIFKSYPLSTSDFQKNKFHLYPNPATSELFLSSKNITGNLTIKIFNVAGKLLSNQTLELENQTAIDVSNLTSGMYFLNIEDESGKMVVKKFIKE